MTDVKELDGSFQVSYMHGSLAYKSYSMKLFTGEIDAVGNFSVYHRDTGNIRAFYANSNLVVVDFSYNK